MLGFVCLCGVCDVCSQAGGGLLVASDEEGSKTIRMSVVAPSAQLGIASSFSIRVASSSLIRCSPRASVRQQHALFSAFSYRINIALLSVCSAAAAAGARRLTYSVHHLHARFQSVSV